MEIIFDISLEKAKILFLASKQNSAKFLNSRFTGG